MGRKLTEEQFIEQAKNVHGDVYDYFNVEYVTTHKKVKIICKIHGEFEQTPASHLSGKGCPDCGGSKKLTKEQFIEKANNVHGERYDYSLVEYETNNKKVKIICPIHGEFEQRTSDHLKGCGCSGCSGTKKLTTEQFIEKARNVHGDLFDYSLVDYIGRDKPVKIICKVHGEFEQRPGDHLSGKGCSVCSGKKKSNTEEFIEKAKVVHGNRYDYSNVEYITTRKKVKIICKVHGIFDQTPTSHLIGQGCQDCSGNKKSNTEEFIEKSKNIHGETYDYSKVEYISAFKKVKIICKTHGEFTQTPHNHLKCSGCPDCAETGFNKNKPGILYYIKFESEFDFPIYKIGITNLSVKERIKSMQVDKDITITILKEFYFESGQECYDLEQLYHKEFKQYSYEGDDIMDNGNTELYHFDVLNLDFDNIQMAA